MLPVVLLAGGLGTRVASLSRGLLPKAMLEVAGRPFIDFKLADLAAQGVGEVHILVAHLAAPLVEHVGDGSAYGLSVRFVDEGDELLGTGGAIAAALDRLPDRFFVSYADTYLPVDLASVEAAFVASGCRGLMTVLHNRDELQPSNAAVRDGRVVEYRKGAPPGTFEYIDYGLLAFAAAVFAEPDLPNVCDLATVFARLISRGDLAACIVSERFHDIGTPEDLRETELTLAALGVEERLARHLPPLRGA